MWRSGAPKRRGARGTRFGRRCTLRAVMRSYTEVLAIQALRAV
jgi:hypothetical protein